MGLFLFYNKILTETERKINKIQNGNHGNEYATLRFWILLTEFYQNSKRKLWQRVCSFTLL